MSRIGEELAKINEGIGGEPTGTSDAALEIKRIIKALDPDASTDGGTLENIVKIRELVEDGKGGGDVSLKTINISNESQADLEVNVGGVIIDGKYGWTIVSAGETVPLKYIEPAEAQGDIPAYEWSLFGACSSSDFQISSEDDHVSCTKDSDEYFVTIVANAEDNATVTITDSVG